MEVRHNRQSSNTTKAERRGVIIQLWRELGESRVDATLLKAIESRLVAAFGDQGTPGPAAIARLLADEGAALKHPEIIEADAEWRQARIQTSASKSGLEQLSSPEMMTLAAAEKLIDRLERLRKQHELNEDGHALVEILSFASESRRLAESIARNRSAEGTHRAEQAEIAEWLKVWLQTPTLFTDWLELRKRSDEFHARFRMND